jgi:hypothetical protein
MHLIIIEVFRGAETVYMHQDFEIEFFAVILSLLSHISYVCEKVSSKQRHITEHRDLNIQRHDNLKSTNLLYL